MSIWSSVYYSFTPNIQIHTKHNNTNIIYLFKYQWSQHLSLFCYYPASYEIILLFDCIKRYYITQLSLHSRYRKVFEKLLLLFALLSVNKWNEMMICKCMSSSFWIPLDFVDTFHLIPLFLLVLLMIWFIHLHTFSTFLIVMEMYIHSNLVYNSIIFSLVLRVKIIILEKLYNKRACKTIIKFHE